MIDYVNNNIRKAPLHRMFSAVPRRYDLVNHVVTWGLDKRWRWQLAKECLDNEPKKLLDLCSGTGDLVINMAQLADNSSELTALDYAEPMLTVASRKASKILKNSKIKFVHGEAGELPFPDGYFDCVGISFAFRNLTYKNPLAQQHIAEVLRVLQPGGRFVIAETSQPESGLIRKLFHLYLRQYVFRVGNFISGNRGAYSYLAESATRFYTADELKKILINAGFRHISIRPFLLGAVAIHTAIK